MNIQITQTITESRTTTSQITLSLVKLRTINLFKKNNYLPHTASRKTEQNHKCNETGANFNKTTQMP